MIRAVPFKETAKALKMNMLPFFKKTKMSIIMDNLRRLKKIC